MMFSVDIGGFPKFSLGKNLLTQFWDARGQGGTCVLYEARNDGTRFITWNPFYFCAIHHLGKCKSRDTECRHCFVLLLFRLLCAATAAAGSQVSLRYFVYTKTPLLHDLTLSCLCFYGASGWVSNCRRAVGECRWKPNDINTHTQLRVAKQYFSFLLQISGFFFVFVSFQCRKKIGLLKRNDVKSRERGLCCWPSFFTPAESQEIGCWFDSTYIYQYIAVCISM